MWYTYSGFADEISEDLTVQMDSFSELGIRYIEPRGIGGKNISEITPEEARGIKAKMDARDFHVSAIGSPVGKVELSVPSEEEEEKLRRMVELAKIFETKYIRVFSPFLPEGEAPKKYRDVVMKRMQKLLDVVKNEDIILLHENEGGYIYGQAPENCLDLFETLGSDKLRATYDPGNFVYAGFDAWESYQTIKKHIEYIHIKDSAGIDSVVAAGEGKVQYVEILKDLKKMGRHFFLSHEPHLVEFEGLASIDNNGFEVVGGDPKEMFTLAVHNFAEIMKKVD